MGMKVEFYAADPARLVSLFEADLVSTQETGDAFFRQLAVYPMADFSLHLRLPEDGDTLCKILHTYNSLIPPVFREILVQQVWDDGSAMTESLTRLSDQFVEQVANLDEYTMEKAARDWAATFPYQGPLWQTPAYHALWQLQGVARNALSRKQALILRVAGHPLF